MVEWRNKSKQSCTRDLTWNSGLFSYKIFCCKAKLTVWHDIYKNKQPQTPTKKLKHINPIHTSLTLVPWGWIPLAPTSFHFTLSLVRQIYTETECADGWLTQVSPALPEMDAFPSSQIIMEMNIHEGAWNPHLTPGQVLSAQFAPPTKKRKKHHKNQYKFVTSHEGTL